VRSVLLACHLHKGWCILRANAALCGRSVFVHPDTGDEPRDQRDQRDRALWLGRSYVLTHESVT
jgi:aromatic ring-cleaving dioxygenase